jgi:hypothetical protein
MTEAAIRHRLVKRERTLFDAPLNVSNSRRSRLLNDLDRYPHFVIACVIDRQIAWLIPHAVAERLGGFSMNILAKLS